MAHDTTLQLVRSSLPPKLRHHVHSARELDRSRSSQASRELFPTPFGPLNRLLAGGLARGELVELVGRRSCGSFSILLSTLSTVTRGGQAAALVDLAGGFSLCSAKSVGVCQERLLWLRPQHLGEALAATEILISGDFRFIAMDLGSSPGIGRGPQGAWLRLARAARERRAVLWVVTPHRVSGNAADTVIEARPGGHVWDRSRRDVSLLHGIHSELVLRKRAGTAPGSRETLTFHADSSWTTWTTSQISDQFSETSCSERSPLRMVAG